MRGSTRCFLVCSLFGLAVALFSECASVGLARAAAAADAQAVTSFGGFTFESGPCLAQRESNCADYKPWQPEEKALIIDVLKEIRSLTRGEALMRASGISSFRRKSTDGDPGNQSANAFAITGTGNDFITVLDRTFLQTASRDRFSGPPGYRFPVRIVVHELFHAIDRSQKNGRRLSDDPTFRQLAGFTAGGRFAFGSTQLDTIIAEVNRLNDEGQIEPAWQLSRRSAMALKAAPLPSLQAIINRDIEKVCLSVASCFEPAVHERPLEPIIVEPSTEWHPKALYARHEDGSIRVRLAVRGRHWAQFAFQFGHEFCHTMSNLAHSHSDLSEHSKWIEESFCELASLYALRQMSLRWQAVPPYENWRDYSGDLRSYADDRCSDPEHQLPVGTRLQDWIAPRAHALALDPYQRSEECNCGCCLVADL